MSVDTGGMQSADGGNEPQLDLSAQIGDPQQQQVSEGNPAWNEVLGIIPKEFHPQVTPHFKQWDQNFQQSLEKAKAEATKPYQAYQQFVDNRINPQELVAAYQVFQGLNEKPLDIYNRLGDMLRSNGLLQPDEKLPEETEEEVFKDPRVDKVLEQQQLFMQQFQAQQQQAQQQQALQQFAQQMDAQIEDEFGQLSQSVGQIPDWLRLELINRASTMTDTLQRPVSILEAFQNFQQVQSQVQKVSPSTNAPRVIPSGGGFPAGQPTEPDAFKTVDGRAAAVKAIIDRYNT